MIYDDFNYAVVDFYEDVTGEMLGRYKTLREAKKACSDFTYETDGECSLVIYKREKINDRKSKWIHYQEW